MANNAYDGHERRSFRLTEPELERLEGMIRRTMKDEMRQAFGLFGIDPDNFDERNAWGADRAWTRRRRLEEEQNPGQHKKALLPAIYAAAGGGVVASAKYIAIGLGLIGK